MFNLLNFMINYFCFIGNVRYFPQPQFKKTGAGELRGVIFKIKPTLAPLSGRGLKHFIFLPELPGK